MRSINIFSLAVLLGLVNIPVQAQVLTLSDAIQRALEQNPAISATRYQVKAANAATRVAQGAHLPQLDLNYIARQSNNPLDAFADKLNTRSVDPALDFTADALNEPDPSTLYNTQLSLRIPVYAGGADAAGVRVASAREQGAVHRRDRVQAQVIHQTIQAYRKSQATTKALAISDDAVKAAKEHVKTTSQLARAGRIITSDKLTAEIYLAGIQAQYEQARLQVDLAIEQLLQVTGLDTKDETILSSWQANSNIPVGKAKPLVQQALATRKDLLSLESQIKAAEARVDQASAAYQPRVDVIATSNWYDQNGGFDEQSWAVGGVINMNLYAGDRHRQQIAANKFRANMMRDKLRQQQLMVRRQVRSAIAREQAARRRLKISSRYNDKARQTVRLIKKRYGQGRTILIDLLQAERALIATRQETLAAGLELQLAYSDLNLATGKWASANWQGELK